PPSLPSRRGWGRASSRLTAWPWTGPGVFREADHRAWAARPREGEEGARGTEGGESTMGGGRKGMTTPQVIASSWEPGQTIIRGLAGRQTSCAKVNTAPSVRLTSFTRLTHSLLAPKIPRPCWRTNAPVSGLLTCKAINLERQEESEGHMLTSVDPKM
ncbi:unnamed protein product, partial [Prorocentrum cordatum]